MGASDTKRLLFYVTLWSYAGVTPFTSWSDNREKPHITLCPHCCFHSISTDSQPWRCEVSFKDKTLDGPKLEKKKKRWIACRLMGRQTCQHGGAYKSPTMTRQMKKSRCAGRRGVLVYKHPVSWVTVVQLKVIRSTPVHSSSAAAYGAALGLARWISHMDSSPVSMMKRLILL